MVVRLEFGFVRGGVVRSTTPSLDWQEPRALVARVATNAAPGSALFSTRYHFRLPVERNPPILEKPRGIGHPQVQNCLKGWPTRLYLGIIDTDKLGDDVDGAFGD